MNPTAAAALLHSAADEQERVAKYASAEGRELLLRRSLDFKLTAELLLEQAATIRAQRRELDIRGATIERYRELVKREELAV